MLRHVQIDSNPHIPAEATHFQEYVTQSPQWAGICRCLHSIAILRIQSPCFKNKYIFKYITQFNITVHCCYTGKVFLANFLYSVHTAY